MQGLLIGMGINSHRLYAHAPGRPDDAAGYLSPIGDKDFFKHYKKLQQSFNSSNKQKPVGILMQNLAGGSVLYECWSMRLTSFFCLLAVVMLMATISSARAADSTLPEISQPGDAAMSCGDIRHEITKMEKVVMESRVAQEKSKDANIGIGVIKTVGSYLVGTLTGTIGFMAAGHIAKEATKEHGDDAAAIENIALQRRSLMIGMHNALECGALPPSQLLPEEEEAQDASLMQGSPDTIEPAAGSEDIRPAHERQDRYN